MKRFAAAFLVVLALAAALGASAEAQEPGSLTIRDRSGASLGRIDADGTFRDRSGALIGRVDAGGTLRDRSGANVGRIDGDGAVRDRSGSLSGRFQGYKPVHRNLAAAYLFFFNPLHRR